MNLILAFAWNVGTCNSMLRDKLKWKNHKSDSAEVRGRGGLIFSSDEAAVMVVERRDRVTPFFV